MKEKYLNALNQRQMKEVKQHQQKIEEENHAYVRSGGE